MFKGKIINYGWVVGAFCLALLVGCASTPPAPVEERLPGKSSSHTIAKDNYVVRGGDTLYSIAFNHGMDYRDLARLNNIVSPYTIYVGQKLHVPGYIKATQANAASSKNSTKSSKSATTPTLATVENSPATSNKESTSTAESTKSAAQEKSTNTESIKPPAVPATTSADKASPSVGVAWHWPAKGQVVGTYVVGDPTRQGIDIAGKAGDPVLAAADGVVVYSGNGLIGYGELIIVKHNPSFLSAYGHNRKRLVQEGDSIKAEQPIAEMGSSGASRDMLHFEIRRTGKPINPLEYLPKR